MNIPQNKLLHEFMQLQMHLNPVLSDHYKDVLKAVEQQLTSGGVSPSFVEVVKKTRVSQKIKKKALVSKYLNK